MAVRQTGHPYNAGIDANNWPSLTAVSGTAGTADTTGTAEIIALGGNPTTGALYVQDLSGASGTTNVSLVSSGGTITRIQTIGTLELGSMTNIGTNVNVVTGTQQTLGTVGTVPGIGTITNIGSISNIGTMPAVGGGTQFAEDAIHSSGAGGNLMLAVRTDGGTALAADGDYHVLELDANGALRISGTVTTGAGTQAVRIIDGTVTNLATGTLTALAVGTIGGKAASGAAAVANPVQIAGTDSGGTIYSPLVTTGGILSANMPTGTVTTGSLANVAILHAGTVNASLVSSNGTITQVTTVANLTNGSINILTGTVTRVSNVGTLESGTVRIDSVPPVIGTSYGTLGTTGAAVIGTLVAAAGAGTRQYISGLSMVVQSGTVDCAITNVGTVAGPNGNGVLARGQFPPGGGIMRDFFPTQVSGTNGTIGYWMGGAGTVYFTVQYWNGV